MLKTTERPASLGLTMVTAQCRTNAALRNLVGLVPCSGQPSGFFAPQLQVFQKVSPSYPKCLLMFDVAVADGVLVSIAALRRVARTAPTETRTTEGDADGLVGATRVGGRAQQCAAIQVFAKCLGPFVE